MIEVWRKRVLMIFGIEISGDMIAIFIIGLGFGIGIGLLIGSPKKEG